MPLKNRNGAHPPGSFPFRDPRTGFAFDGMSGGTFDNQVHNIQKHRLANPKIYDPSKDGSSLTIDGISNELDAYTCSRLGGSGLWCTENMPIKAKIYQSPISGKPCQFCGVNALEPIYCKTCGGKKITGWHCNACGKDSK